MSANAKASTKPSSSSSSSSSDKPEQQADWKPNTKLDKYSWLIRPCSAYKEELKVCESRAYRKHHVFVHGVSPDCSQWSLDAQNCLDHETDRQSFEALVLSEMRRRHERLRTMTGNTVWQYRDQPAPEWNSPLPDASASDATDQAILEAADKALDDSLDKYGILGPTSLLERVSFCALM